MMKLTTIQNSTTIAAVFSVLLLASASTVLPVQAQEQNTATGESSTNSAAAKLPDVVVVGEKQGALPLPYAGGQMARGGRLGMLGNSDFMDTPFSFSSYTAQLVQDQQARTLADVTANDSSVRATASSGGILDSFYIRGFPINEGNFGEVAFDGVYGIAPAFRLFTDYAERIEVVKGPTAMLNGVAPNSSVGGAINVVPKRAGDTDLTQFTADYATELQGGGHLDLSRRFGAERQFGVRLNSSYHEGDTVIDNQWRRAPVGALALDYRTDRFRATIDGLAQRERFDAPQRPLFPSAGLTAIPDAPEARRNIQQPWEWSQIDDFGGLGRVEYDLNEHLTVFASGGGGVTRVDRLFGTPIILNSAGDASTTPQYFKFDIDRTSVDAGLRARFDTGFIGHSATLQASRFHQTLGRGSVNGTAQATSIYNPTTRPEQNLASPASVPKVSEGEFVGVALSDTLSILDDRVQLVPGVRYQQVDAKNFSPTSGAVTSSSDEAEFTPMIGLIVKPWKNVSLYANYIEGLSIGEVAPAAAINNAGEMLPPSHSTQVETGVKLDFNRVAVTLGVFQIEKPFGQIDAGTFVEGGEQRNRGVEFNVFGEPATGVRLFGGVTLLDAELTETTSAATRGNTPVGVPSVQLNLGGEWDVPFLTGLTLNGRVLYTAEQYVNQANTLDIPDWVRLDLGVRYRTTIAKLPVTFRANVENVLDDNYWSGVASFGTLAQGAPRTVLLSATVDF